MWNLAEEEDHERKIDFGQHRNYKIHRANVTIYFLNRYCPLKALVEKSLCVAVLCLWLLDGAREMKLKAREQ